MNFFYKISVVTLLLTCAGVLHAQISPGKLSKYHVALEGIANCTKCHELGKTATPEKCLACHTPLKARIEAGQGFHASSQTRRTSCIKCHSEHHGIDYELIFWKEGQEKFDHGLTGFKLEGGHAGVACDKCHREQFNFAIAGEVSVNPRRTFLGLTRACTHCHIDEHTGQLGADCIKCHSMASWKPPTGFNHDSTRYPLTGKHSGVDCQKCHQLQPRNDSDQTNKLTAKGEDHKSARYDGLVFTNCSACHEDAHKGKLGVDCAGCHQTSGFRQLTGGAFDHSKTAYPLQGKHLTVACDKCHKTDRKSSVMVFGTCKDCHADRHKGEFDHRADKGACESCHSIEGFFPVRFGLNEHQSSRFPLSGGHLATPCIDCHKPVKDEDKRTLQYSFDSLDCISCHKDPHAGEAIPWMINNACQACHSTNSWREISFDHNRTSFKLSGKHGSISCGACHKPLIAGDSKIPLKSVPGNCRSCHTEPHQKQFAGNSGGGECSDCHTPAGWHWLKFNHDRDAKFSLEGAHKKADCSQCHRTEVGRDGKSFVRYKPVSSACEDCHGKR